MKQELMTHIFGGTVAGCLLRSALVTLVFGSASAFADDGPPPFVFNERCMPYELDPDFMRANGVDPDKIISAFVANGNGVAGPGDVSGTGNNGSFSPWTEDFEADGVTPKPCDEFHTNRRRTRYEGCHFYDGTPCYFVTAGQLDQDSFTDDEAGRRAFEIGEHFVFYEFTQQFEASPPFSVSRCEVGGQVNPFFSNQIVCEFNGGDWITELEFYFPPPLFTDPYSAGFAVGAQTKIMNAAGAYWTDDPIGLWKQGLVNFTLKAQACRTNFDDEDCLFMHDMLAANGTNSQNIGFPLVYTGVELFDLSDRGLVSIRYRLGGDGAAGVPESARYIMCPLHELPANGDISAGNDNVQAYPVHIEWQPPSQFFVAPVGQRGSDTIVLTNLFGPTPPLGTGPFAEGKIVENFHCLQRTGGWCP